MSQLDHQLTTAAEEAEAIACMIGMDTPDLLILSQAQRVLNAHVYAAVQYLDLPEHILIHDFRADDPGATRT